MKCYKDMTFCPFWGDCADAGNCGRAYTEEVKEDATKLKLGVCVYTEKPECYKENCPNCDGSGRETCPLCGGTNIPFPEETE